ncbi:SoxR reducing system RseC family protein [Magnetospirillum aberrantis]|uniref:SoxR reducing system RseC family protein n=1 Tax=Magnetospirillum aberrantis SpK TaxID=908842 RepID=A0A7C9UUR4_9PROT|nr:SoxR reducing system RseC family protein [Magnetospirillum aberrantis]NFV81087.1 SoxR reducing system RseC family protein [Magnetospirillum aberrantis SpK]
MSPSGQPFPEDRDVVESVVRVIDVDGDVVWLEPEQTSACGSCHASAACGAKPGSARLVARRFTLPNDHDFQVGERIVVGVAEQSVRRAALTAYGIPLATMLVSGVTVQKMGGGDLGAAVATLGGLALGIGIVHLQSSRLSKRVEYTPHYLRRASGIDAACGLDRS